jgi:hypothetical protein
MLARLTFIAFLLSASAAAAQWNERGKPVPDDAGRKSDGEFGAMLVVTDKLDQFLREWDKPDDPSHPPYISRAKQAKRGDVVWAVVVFTNCAAGSDRLCRADVDFDIVRPDGSSYASHKAAELWHGPPPPRHILQLSAARLGFQVELNDPLGTYTIRATALDRVANRKVTLEQKLDVRERVTQPPASPSTSPATRGGTRTAR